MNATAWLLKLKTDLDERLLAVGEHLKAALQAEVSQAVSPPASKPGEPLHVATGELHDSIDYHPTENGITFTAADYGVALEYGTLHTAPRPWLRPVMSKEQEAIQRILAG